METVVKLRQKSVGISFAGGGVKSFAELSTYETLISKNIKVSAVTGTSMGSFLAAGVAYGMDPEELEALILATDQALAESELFKKRPVWLTLLAANQSNGLVMPNRLAETVASLHPLYQGMMLSELSMPIAIPTVDIISGKIVVFTNNRSYFAQGLNEQVWEFYDGDITVLEACLASSAYPLMIQPMLIGDYQLVDGGVLMNSPVDLFDRQQTEYVISLGIKRKSYEEPAFKSNEVAMRAMNFLMSQQIDRSISSANVVVQFEVDATTFEFGNAKEIIMAGRQYMLDQTIDWGDLYEREVIESAREEVKSDEWTAIKNRFKQWFVGKQTKSTKK